MVRSRWPVIALFTITAALSVADHLGVFGTVGPDRQRYDRSIATISRVIDGDTFEIDMPDRNGEPTRVRLLGIDCPEIAHAPGEADAHGGREAVEWANAHVLSRRVRIVLDPTRPVRDKYGRLLAYLFLDDNESTTTTPSSEPADTPISINQRLIETGHAYADGRFEHVHEFRFERAERLAMRAKRGLWRTVTDGDMPAWRRRQMEKSGGYGRRD